MSAQEILLIAAGVYLFMGVILVVFAEQIYEWSKGTSMPDSGKGLFAQAIISYYNVKTKGLSAEPKHWIYCLLFNGGVSITVSLIVAFGVGLIILALSLMLAFLVLAALAGGK